MIAAMLAAGTVPAFAGDQPNPGDRTITDRNKSQRLGNEAWDPADPYGRFGDRSRGTGSGDRYIDRLPGRSGSAPWGEPSSPWGASGRSSGSRPVR
jgi:hypothetical protein